MINFKALSGTAVNEIPLARTVADTLECISPKQIFSIAPNMIKVLIRNRVLERYRLFDKYYMIAIDATGWMSFDKPHCDNCLRKTHKSGKVTYYHMVLEAKLVTTTGMALSIATEFVENMDPDATKQDCELKAMPRLLEKLRDVFPSLPICLLLDGLYANQTTFGLCEKHNLEYITTFKSGSIPTLYTEFKTLRQETENAAIKMKHGNESQELSWVNDLNHEGYTVNGFSCLIEEKDKEPRYFAWLTSFSVDRYNIDTLANEGGRLRWKIENEGFNVQKNCEYQMQHVYSNQPIAGKNYYLLMQIAHLLLQLLLHGRICKAMRQRIRELRNFFRLIKEHFTNRVLPVNLTNPNFIPTIQIRLDSS